MRASTVTLQITSCSAWSIGGIPHSLLGSWILSSKRFAHDRKGLRLMGVPSSVNLRCDASHFSHHSGGRIPRASTCSCSCRPVSQGNFQIMAFERVSSRWYRRVTRYLMRKKGALLVRIEPQGGGSQVECEIHNSAHVRVRKPRRNMSNSLASAREISLLLRAIVVQCHGMGHQVEVVHH